MDKSRCIVDVGLGILLRENPCIRGITRQFEVLISRRPESTVYAGWWEIPGGKVDAGETPEQAVVRELREEVGVEATVVGALGTVEHEYDHAHVRLHPRLCRMAPDSPEPAPLHVTECRWIPLADMGRYRFPEANEQVVVELQAWLAERSGKDA